MLKTVLASKTSCFWNPEPLWTRNWGFSSISKLVKSRCLWNVLCVHNLHIFLTHFFYDFQYPRVKPIVTPRFTLSCTETLMSELGNIAKTHDLYIQVGVCLWFVRQAIPACLGTLRSSLATCSSTKIF